MARSARTFQITRILSVRADGSQAVAIPGMRVTVPELLACIADAGPAGTLQVWCEVCGESIADCYEVRKAGIDTPVEWSTFGEEPWQATYELVGPTETSPQAGPVDGVRHAEGLVVFTGAR